MIFDGYLNAGSKDDSEIRNYYTQTQEVKIDRAIRFNSSYYFIFDHFQMETRKIMCCAVLFVC